MSFEQKLNTLSVFKNDKSGPDANPNWPDYRGSVNVEGKMYDISLWLKTSSKGVKYMSGAIQEPRQKKPAKQQEPERGREIDEFDDSIPF